MKHTLLMLEDSYQKFQQLIYKIPLLRCEIL